MWGLPETFLQVAFIEDLIGTYRWFWSLCEIIHFVGLILLVGVIAIIDLRMMGVGKRMPPPLLQKLLPWGVLGFCLCVMSGLVFVTGIWANVQTHPLEAIAYNWYLQLKLLFIALAGLNLLILHYSGLSRVIAGLGAGDDAPPAAQFIGAASLFLWVGVVYWGRLVPWGL